MFQVGIGHSEEVLAEEAVQEVLAQIRSDLGGAIPQAGLLFCGLDFNHTYIINRLREAYPHIELAGCTTDSSFSSIGGYFEDSIMLIVFAADQAEIHVGIGRRLSSGGFAVGRDAALSAYSMGLRHRDENRFAIVLTDPLNAGDPDIISGIEDVLGAAFPVIGASSAAHAKRRTTYQFFNDEVLTDSVVLLLFSGPVQYSFGIQTAHSAVSAVERITASENNDLYSINDKPALEYFKRYIGADHDLFINYFLAISEDGVEGITNRLAPFCDPASGQVTLNGPVKDGMQVQILTANKRACAESCASSIRMALENYPGNRPAAAICFSCISRKRMLGMQALQEEQIVGRLMQDIPYCGFYSYGEISPKLRGSPTIFHGSTFITLLLGSIN